MGAFSTKKPPFFEIKNPKNLAFLRHYSKSKTEEYSQNNLRISDWFGMSISCSAKWLLKMSGCVFIKVATKGCFRSKELKIWHFWDNFSEAKAVQWDQKYLSAFDKLEYLLLLPIFWTWFAHFPQISYQSHKRIEVNRSEILTYLRLFF